MGQGIDKNTAREATSLEPSQLLEFYLIYYDWPEDQNSVLALTPIQKGINIQVIWQGQSYLSYPMEISGFESSGDNTLPRPRVMLSNKDYAISKYLKVHNNLIGAKIVRKRTFAKFLDDSNFEGGQNPFFDVVEQITSASETSFLPDQTFYVNRRVSETKELVELELSSVFELDNVYLPNRNVYARYCTWIYRGHGCRYAGEPKKTGNSQDFTDSDGVVVTPATNKGLWSSSITYNKGDYVFLQIENFILRSDIETDLSAPAERLKTFYVCVADGVSGNENNPSISAKWQKDECSKKISDCKFRYTNNLRFGGFPGTHEYPPKQ
jgi:lambda family phage minor tail protein L